MRSIIPPLLTLGLMNSPALAADLLVPVVPTEPVVVQEAFSWAGAYIGVNAGWAFSGDDHIEYRVSRDPLLHADRGGLGRHGSFGFPEDVGQFRLAGLFAGVQAGFNYQAGILVLGIEGDLQGSGIHDGARGKDDHFFDGGLDLVICDDGPDPDCHIEAREPIPRLSGRVLTASGKSDINWYATARLRAGIAHDRTLIYATGGLALGGIDYTVQFPSWIQHGGDGTGSPVRVLAATTAHWNDTVAGWAVGAGVEYAFTNKLTTKLEYQYLNFGKERVSASGDMLEFQGRALDPDRVRVDGYTAATHATPDVHSVRFGMNLLL